jgi:CheY-like chemotaxis protein
VDLGHEPCGLADRSEAAIRLARERSPDLVLMDVQLAHGDSGIEAAATIAGELGVPVVLVTANAAAMTSRPLPFRPAGLVSKPYSDDALRHAIEAVAA